MGALTRVSLGQEASHGEPVLGRYTKAALNIELLSYSPPRIETAGPEIFTRTLSRLTLFIVRVRVSWPVCTREAGKEECVPMQVLSRWARGIAVAAGRRGLVEVRA